MKKIHKSMKAMKGCKQFEHITKYCDRKIKKVEDYIYSGDWVEEWKYTYTGLLINQIKLYKHLISYLKRKNTQGWARMNWVMVVASVIKKIIRDIKVTHIDTVWGTTSNDLKYTEIDLKKMEWYCYSNLIKIINNIYSMTDMKNMNIEETYKEAGLL